MFFLGGLSHYLAHVIYRIESDNLAVHDAKVDALCCTHLQVSSSNKLYLQIILRWSRHYESNHEVMVALHTQYRNRHIISVPPTDSSC